MPVALALPEQIVPLLTDKVGEIFTAKLTVCVFTQPKAVPVTVYVPAIEVE